MEKTSEQSRASFLHYLPYSEEDEKLGMVCLTVGTTTVAPHTVYPPNKNDHPVLFRSVAEGRILPDFQIVYITKGQGIFNAEGVTYTVNPGSMLLIMPGMRHSYKPVFETGWQEYWVGFNGSFFMKLFREGILSKERLFFQVGLHEQYLNIFDQIFEEVRVQRPLYQFKAGVGIMTLLGEVLAHERRKEQPNYYQKIVEKAKYLMEFNVYGVINLPSIAEQIGISPSRLNEIFKTYTAMTPYQYYIHIKILKAERLLEQPDVSVKEVAFRLGFDDQYYFSRLFKNKTGITPSRWKQIVSR
ncbi:MAG: AraC family transcriptional regulator [Treponema sp.]|jgi:AraC-like DNA-binding protein|nr:AraC family transcriptional regulator [Treponema sp.]